MKKALKIIGILLLLLLLLAAGGYLWASMAASSRLARTYESHNVDFPIPFPLDAREVQELGLNEAEAEGLALERAVQRGEHLVEARYSCTECHGENFGGGVMVDAFPIGSLLGPNLTLGEGSRTASYTPADWDRIVRHGILPDGRPAAMPSEDFQLMSDQELSDIIAYIRQMPPVDSVVPGPKLGPLGKFLVATGRIPLSAEVIEEHDAPHPLLPPEEEATIEFGRHLVATCTGCHGEDLAGGPIAGGDPSWPPARNLTRDPSALGTWTFNDFRAAMQEGRRPDGTPLRPPMTFVVPFGQQMRDVELQAMWIYIQSLPPVPAED